MSCWVCDKANGTCEHRNGNVLTPELALTIERERTATLEARIAEVESENSALWARLDAEIERRVDAEARIAELERERDEARADGVGWMKVYGNQVKTSAGFALELSAARAELDEAVRLLVRVDDDVDYATDDDPLHNGALAAVRAWRRARRPTPDKETT